MELLFCLGTLFPQIRLLEKCLLHEYMWYNYQFRQNVQTVFILLNPLNISIFFESKSN